MAVLSNSAVVRYFPPSAFDYALLGIEGVFWIFCFYRLLNEFRWACNAGCVDCRFVSLEDPPCYGAYYRQQLLAVDWAKFQHGGRLPVDPLMSVGVAGHSMGGQGTLFSAADATYKGYNISAAVLLHPYTHTSTHPMHQSHHAPKHVHPSLHPSMHLSIHPYIQKGCSHI